MKTISRYLLTLVALFAMTAGAWAQQVQDELLVTINSNENTDFTSGSKTFDDIATVTLSGYYVCNDGDSYGWYDYSGGKITVAAANDNYTITRVKFYCNTGSAFDETAPFEADLNHDSDYITKVNGQTIGSKGVTKIEVYGIPASTGPEVTISDDQTSAEFDMPDDDVTFDYELVREMEVNMTTTVGPGYDGYRIRLKKNDQGQGYVPADLSIAEVMALFTVHDGLEEQDLVFYGDGKVCDISIYAIGENDLPTGDPIVFANLEPGRYVARATADEGSAYTGQTAFSNVFELYEGYEVTVPAGEYITYYSDEALTVEDEAAELYTIHTVSGNEATLSNKRDVVPANVAMLVYNNSNEEKTFLLIPTDKNPESFMSYAHFVGTLDATTIPGSDATTDNYAFNGKQFVWVKNSVIVGSNKAWLSIPKAPSNARSISIRRTTTGIGATLMDNEEMNNELYDLNGRKVQNPTKKGIYIRNGRKVVIMK